MVQKFTTKRDNNGNCKVLVIDHASRKFSTQTARWMCKGEFIEIKSRDRRNMIQELENSGYQQVHFCD